MASDVGVHVVGVAPAQANRPAGGRPLRALFEPVDISFLVCFRVSFGAIMLWHVARYFSSGEIESLYVAPKFHFTYFGFEWVKPWPGSGMYLHFFGMGLLAGGILVGLHYRVCALLFWLGFTYQFLLDKSLYQNHYYLISLISFLLIFLPANRAVSLDACLRPAIRSAVVPAWTLWLLRTQMGIPYFYGGIAKLNPDWLRCEPMRHGMSQSHRIGIPLIGQWFTEEWMVVLFSYGGLLLDLFIVPLLLWRRTRLLAFCFGVLFHFLNSIMFNIGIFPWFMILATLVFFEPDWPRRLARKAAILLRLPRSALQDGLGESTSSPAELVNWGSLGQRLTVGLLSVYLAAQLLIPLRHYLYPGESSWTEEGHLFAWHMMLRGKRCALTMLATNPATGETAEVNVNRYLTKRQIMKLGKDPDMLRELAAFIAADAARAGFRGAEVRAISLVSLNGRRPQLLIDPTVDLAAQERTWRPKSWIMPLVEPLPEKPFDEPLQMWPQYAESSWKKLSQHAALATDRP